VAELLKELVVVVSGSLDAEVVVGKDLGQALGLGVAQVLEVGDDDVAQAVAQQPVGLVAGEVVAGGFGPEVAGVDFR